ncbi:hypothetical protein ACE1B6_22920 [Aerosakkonemataceae cyanobacterium BLCC-F154]|uniref:Uncharacterized protein n=1 Tax=Floridaenema fluviatile BLCC-F154 TaxID=3153640 RepID=A0ABV4YH13_9CYAN
MLSLLHPRGLDLPIESAHQYGHSVVKVGFDAIFLAANPPYPLDAVSS